MQTPIKNLVKKKGKKKNRDLVEAGKIVTSLRIARIKEQTESSLTVQLQHQFGKKNVTTIVPFASSGVGCSCCAGAGGGGFRAQILCKLKSSRRS